MDSQQNRIIHKFSYKLFDEFLKNKEFSLFKKFKVNFLDEEINALNKLIINSNVHVE